MVAVIVVPQIDTSRLSQGRIEFARQMLQWGKPTPVGSRYNGGTPARRWLRNALA